MADNRGNSSGTNTNMPSGVTKTKSTDTQISNSVMNAISNVLGTPLKSIQSNTANNVKLTTQIKKELLGFSKDTKKIQENDKKDKKELLKFSNKETTFDKKENAKSDIKNLVKSGSKLFNNFTKNMKSVFDKNKESLQGILGPINLILSPIQDFFGNGVFGKVFTSLGNGIKGIFNKFRKKNPNANDVVKSGAFGVGSLYIINEIKKIFGKDEKKDKKNILNKIPIIGKLIPSLTGLLKSIPILGTFLRGAKLLGKSFGKNALGKGGNFAKFFKSGATKTAFKAMGPMMIVTSLIEMAIDGIKGFFKSKEWGASKISSALGGFLGGASEGGLKNAFSSMGKWALLGAGIGSVVPVVGTIAGGLIGGAIGGILGAIGGKNIAKGFDKIGAWFKNVLWEKIKQLGISLKNVIFDIFNIDKFISIFKSDESIGKKIGKALGTFVITIFTWIPKLLGHIKNGLSKLIVGAFNKSKEFAKAIGNLGASIVNGMANVWDKTKEGASKAWNSIKTFGGDVWEGIKESELGVFVSSLFTSLSDGITKFFKENPVGIWVESHILSPIRKALGTIGDFFSYIGDNWDWKHPIDSMTKIFGGFSADKKTGLSDFDIWRNAKYTEVEDAIIRTDGSIVRTNPKDTLVALKDIPLSMNQVREETNKNLSGSLSQMEKDGSLENKLTTIIDVLSKILAKDLQVQLPPQTRSDLDLLMNGGLV